MKKKNERKMVLSIRQANRLAHGTAIVAADPLDPQLWQVRGEGQLEAHEPMTRDQWLAFLRNYWSK